MVSTIRARLAHGPLRASAAPNRSAVVSRCWTAAMIGARAARSLRAALLMSIRLRSILVRRGARSAHTSSDSSWDDQRIRTPSRAGLRCPCGMTNHVVVASKPRSPSSAAAVGPPSAEPGGAASRLTHSFCSQISGPLCITSTPRCGRCQRRPSSCPRIALRVRNARACRTVSTPHWVARTSIRTRCGTRTTAADESPSDVDNSGLWISQPPT